MEGESQYLLGGVQLQATRDRDGELRGGRVLGDAGRNRDHGAREQGRPDDCRVCACVCMGLTVMRGRSGEGGWGRPNRAARAGAGALRGFLESS